jgi:hypothetical protein
MDIKKPIEDDARKLMFVVMFLLVLVLLLFGLGSIN